MNRAAKPSLPPAYFDAIYARDPDPWRLATSPYERAKYAATIAALPRRHVSAMFEVGCSIGVLTRQLAAYCDWLLAVDVADAALADARIRLADLPHVAIHRMQVPEQWPDETFDLILFSEVLYYLKPLDVARTARLARASLRSGGAVLAVHYVLPTNYPCTADEAMDVFAVSGGFKPRLQQREPEYRLDLLALSA